MRNTWLAAIAWAAVAVACGGSDGANNDRPAQAGRAPDQAQAQAVTLTGCIATGPGSSPFVLQHVQLSGSNDPRSDTAHTRASAITEGSYVRLTSTPETDLSKYIGKKVSLTGIVIDTGTNTIGTSGSTGVETPSGDRSQAATPEHPASKVRQEAGGIAQHTMANGEAAEIRVQTVKETGDSCGQR